MILIKIYFPACNLWSPSQTRLPFENANGGTYWKRGCRSCWNKNSSLFRFRGNCWNGNNNGMLWRTNENSSNFYMRQMIFKAVPFLMWNFFQISNETKNYLKDAGGFSYIKRDSTHPKLPEGLVTFWLIGLTNTGADTTVAEETKSEAKSSG